MIALVFVPPQIIPDKPPKVRPLPEPKACLMFYRPYTNFIFCRGLHEPGDLVGFDEQNPGGVYSYTYIDKDGAPSFIVYEVLENYEGMLCIEKILSFKGKPRPLIQLPK